MAIGSTQSSTAASAATSSTSSNKYSLKAQDFINLMVTQLQHQDPLEPSKNSELLAQMSQIGQLQSSQDLQTSLKGLVLQNSIGSASSMIGKMVTGNDDQGAEAKGIVNSVKVESGSLFLELDSGTKLPLSNVTNINNAAAVGTVPT